MLFILDQIEVSPYVGGVRATIKYASTEKGRSLGCGRVMVEIWSEDLIDLRRWCPDMTACSTDICVQIQKSKKKSAHPTQIQEERGSIADPSSLVSASQQRAYPPASSISQYPGTQGGATQQGTPLSVDAASGVTDQQIPSGNQFWHNPPSAVHFTSRDRCNDDEVLQQPASDSRGTKTNSRRVKQRVLLYVLENSSVRALQAMIILALDLTGSVNGPPAWNLLALITRNTVLLGLAAESTSSMSSPTRPSIYTLGATVLSEPETWIEARRDEGCSGERTYWIDMRQYLLLSTSD
ncbi:hypothetical protein GJ744_007160 [Endocarpon pusillum]|uniref:Uncharacterized protein n=1 Tax=Endocarpon pusillum TaxID=364733 RepID=A0A8H7E7S7_9EURO|nr:hypothetical protein GJ744_007160 [Endocarpon pusillum]